MKTDDDTNFICAFHDVTEEELNANKKNIQKYSSQDVNLNLEQLVFPIFRYERLKLKNLSDQPKAPYAECFTSAFNEDASLLACGYSNGFVNIFDLIGKKEPVRFRVSETPVMSVKWNEKRKIILLVGSADGVVSHWHVQSGKSLSIVKEENNAINCVDYGFDYSTFLTAGTDFTIKIYDESMKTQITILKSIKFEKPGDVGRVFCAKFFPGNTSTIYCGGWDRTIRFFDVRSGKVANSISGPEICGDSLDMSGNILASGAWSTKDQVQLWDIRSLKCVSNVEFEDKSLNKNTYIYSVKFSKRKDKQYLAIGGVNQPLFRLFDMSTFKPDKSKPMPIFGNAGEYSACYTTDFVKVSNTKDLFCCGCGDGGARVYSLTS